MLGSFWAPAGSFCTVLFLCKTPISYNLKQTLRKPIPIPREPSPALPACCKYGHSTICWQENITVLALSTQFVGSLVQQVEISLSSQGILSCTRA